MKRTLFRWLALFSLLLAGCRADQATKSWAASEFQDGPQTLVPGLLEFRYAENRAIAFSMLRSVPENVRKPLIYGMAAVAMTAMLIYAWPRRAQGLWRLAPFALILAGAFGNLQDRITRGYVVDFVRLHWRDDWSWPIFNLADSFISVGMAILIWQGFRQRDPAPASETPAPPATA